MHSCSLSHSINSSTTSSTSLYWEDPWYQTLGVFGLDVYHRKIGIQTSKIVQIEELLSNRLNGIMRSWRINVWATNCGRALCERMCPSSGNVCRDVPSEKRWAWVMWSACFRTYGKQRGHSHWLEATNFQTPLAQAQHRMLVQVIRRESPISATNGACRKVGATRIREIRLWIRDYNLSDSLILSAMNDVAPWIS